MVRLHETTARALCRLGFVLGCWVPTVLVLLYVCAIRTPAYRRWHEACWSDTLGVTVRLGQIRHPRPGMTCYQRCRAFDPETAAEIATINEVDLLSTSSGREVRLSSAAIEWDALHDVLGRAAQAMRQAAPNTERFSLRAQEIVCRQQGTAQRLLGTQLDCLANAAKTQVQGQFRPDDALPTQMVRFEFLRDRSQPPAVWRVRWESPTAAVSVALVRTWWPEAARLGASARVAGRLDAVCRASGWEGRFAGQLSGVELDRLVSEQFPHRLSGSSEWTIQQATFAAGRLTQARGTVFAGPGTISRSLIASGTEWLGWLSFAEEPPAAQSFSDASLVKYDRLAAAFALDREQLVLRGLCREQGDGVLLAGYRAPLLLEPRRAVPATALLKTLAPADEATAWTHAASRTLAGWLPPPAQEAARMARLPARVRPADARPMAAESPAVGAYDSGVTGRLTRARGTSADRSNGQLPTARSPRGATGSRSASGGSHFGTPLR